MAKDPEQGFIFDERFIEAFFHLSDPRDPGWSQHRVIGRKLRPYSLWHRLQLEYGGSPFATSGTARKADLEDAVAVCRTQFPHFARPLRARRISRPFWSLPKEFARFSRYLADYNTTPIMERTDSGGMVESKEPDIDNIFIEIAAYRRHTGCSREEPWNLPMAEVYWMNATFSRSEGAQFEVLTPLVEARRIRLREKRKAMDDELIAKMVSEEGISIEEATKKLSDMQKAARERQKAFARAKRRMRGG